MQLFSRHYLCVYLLFKLLCFICLLPRNAELLPAHMTGCGKGGSVFVPAGQSVTVKGNADVLLSRV